jgi:hypothetical protein
MRNTLDPSFGKLSKDDRKYLALVFLAWFLAHLGLSSLIIWIGVNHLVSRPLADILMYTECLLLSLGTGLLMIWCFYRVFLKKLKRLSENA